MYHKTKPGETSVIETVRNDTEDSKGKKKNQEGNHNIF